MRTSGSGARDGMMTTVPLVMLVLFLTIIVGGPKATLGWFETMLRSLVEWVSQFVS
jgi:hypothetical protein